MEKKMKLQAKIKSKYLDKILSGEKTCEYRQFESIELRDEDGRTAEFDIVRIDDVTDPYLEVVLRDHLDIDWDEDKLIYKIKLGKQIIK